MRISEIVQTTKPETWEQRHAHTQRQQAKRQKASTKLADVQAKATADASAAAAKRARTNDKIADAKRDLAAATRDA